MSGPLLAIDNLVVDFPGSRRMLVGPRSTFRAVDAVSLTIARGETLGLVGESGSGKTTTGRAVLGLVTPTSGRIEFDGHDIAGIAPSARGPMIRHLQVVFQNPYSSLNPALTASQPPPSWTFVTNPVPSRAEKVIWAWTMGGILLSACCASGSCDAWMTSPISAGVRFCCSQYDMVR